MKFSLMLSDLTAEEVVKLLAQVGQQAASAFPAGAQPSGQTGYVPQPQTLQPGPGFVPQPQTLQPGPGYNPNPPAPLPPAGPAPAPNVGQQAPQGEITAQHVFPAMQQYVGVYGPDGVKGLLSRLGLPMVITACSAPQLMLAKAAFESGASPDKLGLDANGQLVRYQ
jgi:hypothetical protein